uniref:Uncharacterized protein n=1 Tax=Solanum lycopersicum TaxID=4081 RepID=A0A494GA32_SOLLC|nr:protein HOTHEAD-like [Solanum lycopersicum]
MAVVGPLSVIFNLLLSLLVCHLHFTILIQGSGGEGRWEDKYPFIREASRFDDYKNSYDYIIVGGGTAGCPLAATLSKKFKVLLVERGGVPFTNTNVSFMQNFHISLADTSSTSASQFFVSTDGVFNSRARILGGATCINAGFYTRAGPRYVLFYLIHIF